MLVEGTPYRTVWMESGIIKMIDQTLLPHEFKIISLPTHKETATAIRDMKVRGAGAIGATAGFGMAQVVLEAPADNFSEYLKAGKAALENTRPTARNLFYATNRVFAAVQNLPPTETQKQAVQEAQTIADEDAENCRQIGLHGAKLIQNGYKIGTHCSATALAFVDIGSATAPIYQAVADRKDVFVYVDETRPRNQGATLTSWELLNAGIKHQIIPDNAAGFLMQKKEIDMVIVGCDRLCGEDSTVCNKIGTYEKAVCAKDNGIPFYVALPTTTIDWNCQSGDQIPIEERSEDEVLFVWGKNDKGEFERVRIAPEGSRARNLSFDLTPARLITGLITEKGIFKPDELYKLRPKQTPIM